MARRLLPIAVLLTLAAAAPASARIALPDGWQPEGIAAGPGGSLFVGSIPTGDVLRLNPRTGKYRTVIDAPDGRKATGIEVDGRRVVVAGGDTGQIYVYDRRTGDTLLKADPQGGFVNDVAKLGRDYFLTDSRKQQLYRIRFKGLQPKESFTIQTPDIPLEGDLNLNGIETMAGRLVAVQSSAGKLWRIDADGGARQITVSGGELTNGDGLLRTGKRKLLVVRNRLNKIAVVKLNRRLTKGRVQREIGSDDFDVPTTLARQGGHLYAVNARFGTEDPGSAAYWVTTVR